MKIMLVQASPKVGDLKYNFALISNYYQQAVAQSADICLLSECFTTGYPPQDLLLKPAFIAELHQHLERILPTIGATTLILPTPFLDNGQLFNAVLAMENGKIIGKTAKTELPNYGVFDEKRYFTAGSPQIIEVKGHKIGIPICEDLWFPKVPGLLQSMGAELLLVPNASPYDKTKLQARLEAIRAAFEETTLPIIYCNQVGSCDGLVFDGSSLAFDGEVKVTAAAFTQSTVIIEVSGKNIASHPLPPALSQEDEIYGAMVLGLRSYLDQNGFASIILGLSGGIDSALVAALAAEAIAPENVMAVMMPSEFTSKESLEDAQAISKMLGIGYQIIPIDQMLHTAKETIGEISAVAYENLQARIRGNILMTLANSSAALLLTTGNKSEIATGYTTLYGDMCGGFNPIGDLYKTEVFKLANFRNNNIPKSIAIKDPAALPIMPARVQAKAPSAELSLNQKDSDNLPEYSLLDQILTLYIEQDLGRDEIINLGFDEIIVSRVIKLVKAAEFKRRQSAPFVKISSRSFSKERRYPISNGFDG